MKNGQKERKNRKKRKEKRKEKGIIAHEFRMTILPTLGMTNYH